MYLQRTIQKEVACSSVGLHTGRKISMTVKPAAANEQCMSMGMARECNSHSLEFVTEK